MRAGFAAQSRSYRLCAYRSQPSGITFLKGDPMLIKKIMLPVMACVMSVCFGFVCAPSAPAAECVPVIITGQTACYDGAGNGVNCLHTGQDGEHRAGMAWPRPRFSDNGDGTVLDHLTALVWTKDAQQIRGTMGWADALAACNDLDFAGHSDWRLPNVRELLSLIDYAQHDPALPEGHPFAHVQFIFYWSGTTYDAAPVNAWGVYLCNGYVFNYHKATGGYVWPVRCATQAALP